jgi:hypothetical protein
VGGVAGTSVSVASDTSLTFVTPVRAGADRTAGPGAVVVTTSGGASAGSTLYTFRPVLESISSIPTGSSSQGLVTLGSLAAASQRKPVSRTTLQPYTVSGTYSAGTSAAAGDGYSYVTDRDYTGATAYQYESDERALRSGSSLTTTATIATGGGRSSTYKLTSAGNCEPRPNGATGSPTSNNYSDGYQTYCSVFGPEVYSESFYVGSGMSLAFDWAAEYVSDDYEVYGYLISLTDLTDTSYTGADYSVVAHGIGNGASGITWYTASAAIPAPGYYKFRFVNGTYDATGGQLIGSNMYIDPQAVIVARTNAITFPALADIVGAANASTTTVTLSSTAGGTVSVVSSTTGVCTVSAVGNTYTITKVADGTCVLSATQGATGEYAPATTVLRSFQYLAAAVAPVVSTGLSSSVSASGAALSGSVTPRGAATDGSFCYGTASSLAGCTSVVITPQIGATDAATTISTSLTGLLAATTYYYRASGVNSVGTTNGLIRSFTTSVPGVPSVTTDAASPVSSTGVTLNATVTANGGATTTSFVVCTDAGMTAGCVTTTVSGTTNGTAVAVPQAITGLAPSTTYYFKASVNNGSGSAVDGSMLSFTTAAASGGGSSGGGGSTPEPTQTATATPVVAPASLPSLDPVVIPVTDAVRPGGSAILVGGVPVATAVAPNASSTGLTVSGPDWSLGLGAGAVTPEGRPAPLGRGGVVDARTGTSLAVSGVSFAPGTQVKVYILAPPMTLGTLTVNADGTFSGRVSLPLTLSPGSYTVQVNGYSPGMSLRSASLGIGLQSSAKSVVKRIKRTVYFDRLSSRLTPKSKKVIAAAVRQVPRAATNVSVQMVAYVQREDYRGNDFILSAKRAKIVGASLKAKGVKGRYYESGRGRATQGGSKARRTEIVIAYTIKR